MGKDSCTLRNATAFGSGSAMVCCLHYCFLPKRMFTILSFVYIMMVILLFFVFRLDFFFGKPRYTSDDSFL